MSCEHWLVARAPHLDMSRENLLPERLISIWAVNTCCRGASSRYEPWTVVARAPHLDMSCEHWLVAKAPHLDMSCEHWLVAKAPHLDMSCEHWLVARAPHLDMSCEHLLPERLISIWAVNTDLLPKRLISIWAVNTCCQSASSRYELEHWLVAGAPHLDMSLNTDLLPGRLISIWAVNTCCRNASSREETPAPHNGNDSAILCFRADPLIESVVCDWMSDCIFTHSIFNVHRSGSSAASCYMAGATWLKLLPSRRKFYVHHATMHQHIKGQVQSQGDFWHDFR